MNDKIQKSFLEHIDVAISTHQLLEEQVYKAGRKLSEILALGGTVFWCGNGGSAADSQHIAAELIGRFKGNRKPLRSIALTTDTSVISCISNDYSYGEVFSRQVEGLGRAGDVLVVISTSGNSQNILNAINQSKTQQMSTIGLFGGNGGHAATAVDLGIVIPSYSTARIQEMHILIGHIFCEIIESELKLDEQ
jgi:D-sedoheptulose 7-phosphate isomerase